MNTKSKMALKIKLGYYKRKFPNMDLSDITTERKYQSFKKSVLANRKQLYRDITAFNKRKQEENKYKTP